MIFPIGHRELKAVFLLIVAVISLTINLSCIIYLLFHWWVTVYLSYLMLCWCIGCCTDALLGTWASGSCYFTFSHQVSSDWSSCPLFPTKLFSRWSIFSVPVSKASFASLIVQYIFVFCMLSVLGLFSFSPLSAWILCKPLLLNHLLDLPLLHFALGSSFLLFQHDCGDFYTVDYNQRFPSKGTANKEKRLNQQKRTGLICPCRNLITHLSMMLLPSLWTNTFH